MKLTIGILSEGATEQGMISLQQPLKPVPEEMMGALHELVRRIMEKSGVEEVEFLASPRTAGRGKGGLLKNLDRLLVEYDEAGAAVIVVVVDRAGENQTLKWMGDAVEKAGTASSTVLGEAIEMFEAWLIADEEAIARLLGTKSLSTGPDPESRPGTDNQPDSAKNWLHRYYGEHDVANFYEMNRRLAREIDIEKLSTRCPHGFLRFKNELSRFVAKSFQIE